MTQTSMIDLVSYLGRFNENDWLAAVESMLTCIHEVDRIAVQVWFRFYPLTLQQKWAVAGDREEFIRSMALQGDFELADQIDTSHHFLYGHRYWKAVKTAVIAQNEDLVDGEQSLTDQIKLIGMRVAEKTGVDRHLVNAIAAVGLMTLNQVGLELFSATPGEVSDPSRLTERSPEAMVADRKKDDPQGLFGFLKTVDKKFSVTYMNGHRSGRFSIINEQEIASASAADRSHDWKSEDPRCWEGVVPTECVSASCGTCWVGVLGGREKLSEMSPRERRALKVFGYDRPEGEAPFIRLACQAKATGNVTIVIPPWNGVFGKKVYGNVEELELEPVTTSAKALREAVVSAVSDDPS